MLVPVALVALAEQAVPVAATVQQVHPGQPETLVLLATTATTPTAVAEAVEVAALLEQQQETILEDFQTSH
jgi:hypothetical protein